MSQIKIITSDKKDIHPQSRKKQLFKKVIYSLLVLFIIFLVSAGRFLVINEEPEVVDTIIVLSGGEERLEKASVLYKKGYASKLILSNGVVDGSWNKAVKHLPRRDLILERKAESTYESAVYIKNIMKKYHFDSAIIVSSDYHMRRVKYNFSRVYKGSKDKLIYVSSDTSYNPKTWWLSKPNVSITVSEYVKIIGNTFGVQGNEEKRKLYKYVEKFFE